MINTSTYIALRDLDLLIASGLVVVNAALSLLLGLGVARQMLIAAVRMVVQLAVMALVLVALFRHATPALTALTCLVMLVFAGYEISNRQARPLAGWWTWGLSTGAVFLSGTAVSLLALTTQIHAEPWWDPRYALPLLGMIVGNTMNGISQSLNALTSQAYGDRLAIEARLALGGTRWQALRPAIRAAARAGLMGIINSMASSGLVFIPGMMAGQLLTGVPPMDAARYQILIMFLIAGGTGLGTVIAIMLGSLRLTDDRHRLRLERLQVRAKL